MKQLEEYITAIPDFPQKGIIFRDITTIINDKNGFKMAIDQLVDALKGVDFDHVVAIESRGFVFGAPIAYALGKDVVLVRKKGKLPRETISETYDLEYGTATIEVHVDSVKKGEKVIIIDDLLATGGTIKAAANLMEKLGADIVKIATVIELAGLEGRKHLGKYDVVSLITYEGK